MGESIWPFLVSQPRLLSAADLALVLLCQGCSVSSPVNGGRSGFWKECPGFFSVVLLSASRPHISSLPAPTLTAAVFHDLGKVNSGSPDCSSQFTLVLAFPSPNFRQEMWSNPHLFFLNLENEDSRYKGKLEEGFYWCFKKNQVGILAPPPTYKLCDF